MLRANRYTGIPSSLEVEGRSGSAGPRREAALPIQSGAEREKSALSAIVKFCNVTRLSVMEENHAGERAMYAALTKAFDRPGVSRVEFTDELKKVAARIRKGTTATMKYAGDISAQVAFNVAEAKAGGEFVPAEAYTRKGDDGVLFSVSKFSEAVRRTYRDTVQNVSVANDFRKLCEAATFVYPETGLRYGPTDVDPITNTVYLKYRTLPLRAPGGEMSGATLPAMRPSFQKRYAEVTKAANAKPVERATIPIDLRSSHSKHHRRLHATDGVLKALGDFDTSYDVYNTTPGPGFNAKLGVTDSALTRVSKATFHVKERLNDYHLRISGPAMSEAIGRATRVHLVLGQYVMNASEGSSEDVRFSNDSGKGCRRLTLKITTTVMADVPGNPAPAKEIGVSIVVSALETQPYDGKAISATVIFVITVIPEEVLVGGPLVLSNGAPIDPYGVMKHQNVVNVIPPHDGSVDADALAQSVSTYMQKGDPWTGVDIMRERGSMPVNYLGIEFDHVHLMALETRRLLASAAASAIAKLSDTPITPQEVLHYLSKHLIPTIGLGGVVWHPLKAEGNMRIYTAEDLLVRWAMCYLFTVGMNDDGIIKSLHVQSLQRAQAAQIPPCVFERCVLGWNVSAPMMLEALKCGDKAPHASAITEKIGNLQIYSSKNSSSGFGSGRGAADPSSFSFLPRRSLVIAPMKVAREDLVHGRSYTVDAHGDAWDHDLQIIEAVHSLVDDVSVNGVPKPKSSAEMVIWTPQYMIVVSLMVTRGGMLEGAAYLSTAARTSAVAPTYHASKAVTATEHTVLRVHYAAIGRPGAQGYMQGMIDSEEQIASEILPLTGDEPT